MPCPIAGLVDALDGHDSLVQGCDRIGPQKRDYGLDLVGRHGLAEIHPFGFTPVVQDLLGARSDFQNRGLSVVRHNCTSGLEEANRRPKRFKLIPIA